MTPADIFAIALVLLIGLVLGSGAVLVLLALHWRRRELLSRGAEPVTGGGRSFIVCTPGVSADAPHPTAWLAVRCSDPFAVQAALALTNPRTAAWSSLDHPAAGGLAADQQLFVTPPVNGWVLVMGEALPDPDDDVDECFRFLLGLSRKVGEVQFFQADRVLHRHAWARIEAGRVVRAYAWAGRTLWNQGPKTAAETSLGLKCFSYDESDSAAAWPMSDLIAANVGKVALLAARWSLNVAAIDPQFWEERHGIAGRFSRRG